MFAMRTNALASIKIFGMRSYFGSFVEAAAAHLYTIKNKAIKLKYIYKQKYKVQKGKKYKQQPIHTIRDMCVVDRNILLIKLYERELSTQQQPHRSLLASPAFNVIFVRNTNKHK